MFNIRKLFSKNPSQRPEVLYLQHVPKEYTDLGTAQKIEEVNTIARSLETIEEHHSPFAYANWFVSLLNITYPLDRPLLSAESVKLAAAPLVPIFAAAQKNFDNQLLEYRTSLHSKLLCQEAEGGRGRELFIKGPISASLLQIPVLSREQRASIPLNQYLERSRGGGMGIETVYINPEWIDSFDNLSLLWSTENHIAWYHNRFTNATHTGSLLH